MRKGRGSNGPRHFDDEDDAAYERQVQRQLEERDRQRLRQERAAADRRAFELGQEMFVEATLEQQRRLAERKAELFRQMQEADSRRPGYGGGIGSGKTVKIVGSLRSNEPAKGRDSSQISRRRAGESYADCIKRVKKEATQREAKRKFLAVSGLGGINGQRVYKPRKKWRC